MKSILFNHRRRPYISVEEISFYLHFPALSKTSAKAPLSTNREDLIIAA